MQPRHVKKHHKISKDIRKFTGFPKFCNYIVRKTTRVCSEVFDFAKHHLMLSYYLPLFFHDEHLIKNELRLFVTGREKLVYEIEKVSFTRDFGKQCFGDDGELSQILVLKYC